SRIEFRDKRQQILRRNRSRGSDGLVVDAEVTRRFGLVSDVDLRRGVVTHKNNSKSRGPPSFGNEGFDARAALGFYLITNTISIENCGHQTTVTNHLRATKSLPGTAE